MIDISKCATKRLIARLDIKGSNLIKGVHLEGLRVVGDPSFFAKSYYDQGIDELIYNDVVASLYGRNHLQKIINKAALNTFVPLTVGGGVRSIEDVASILNCGGDKISINTAAVYNPLLLQDIACIYGSQVLVVNIEAKKIDNNKWIILTNNGRESTGIDVVDWAKKVEDLGAGEILLTSVDCEGTTKGFDLELIRLISNLVSIPVIASGGFGHPRDALQVFESTDASAVAIAHSLHYNEHTVAQIRSFLRDHMVNLRDYD